MKNRRKNTIRRCLIGAAVVLILAGAFMIGIGIQQMLDNVKVRSEYRSSELVWKNELVDGLEEDAVRDIKNQALANNMKYISIERQIMLESGESKGEARIANGKDSNYSCTITLLRDATGEIIYESGLIDPGFYIEKIQLKGKLKKGYYPCTAVWNFYTKDEEYVGETAWKLVIIIKN